ncbi:hypothetical protein QAD02_007390 [Eretmocerus hayati]|uniref:Uncharacterized protein n=1 Tax=Eretmocerus hayati TaxID=131215 RepID=A0ACC2N461_9HYME|nr:hypothetical protein QAD02_007390 [Eretmocerus hayati]
MERLIATLVQKYPIIYDKRQRAVANCGEKVADAFEKISLEIHDKYGRQIPAEAVKKIWERHAASYRQSKIRASVYEPTATCSSATTNDRYIAFMDSLMCQRPMVCTNLDDDEPKPKKKCKQKKGKRTSTRPFSRLQVVPPLDGFAARNFAARSGMESSIQSLQNIVQDVHNSMKRVSEQLPNSGIFNNILRAVKLIEKDKYKRCLDRILNELLTL